LLAQARSLLGAGRARLLTPSLENVLRRQAGHWPGAATFVLSFDVETRADCAALPALLDRLDDLALPATFACIGAWAEAYPREHEAIVRSGHEVIDHTDRHPSHDELSPARRFDELTDEELDHEIVRARTKLQRLGASVLGFRSPHFGVMHTERVYAILRREGIAYSSSTVATRTPSGAPLRIGGVWEFPVLACPQHPTEALDPWHCTTAPGARHADAASLVGLYRRALDLLVTHRAYGSVYWDPSAAALPGYAEVLRLLAEARDRVRLTTYGALLSELDEAAG